MIVWLFSANIFLPFFPPVFSLIPVSVFSPAIRKATLKMSFLWSLQIDLLMDPASKTKGMNVFSGLQLHLLLNHIMAFYMGWSSKELLWRRNLFKLRPHGWSVLLVPLETPLSTLLGTIRFLQDSYQLILFLPLWQQNRVNCQHLTKHLTSQATKLLFFFLQVFGDCT